MIVKFIKNKGSGSAGASIDYLLGKDRNREQARVLSGNPELTAQLADSLDFKNKYTVGVLSFQEQNLDEKTKKEIMQSFEQTLMAGLEQNQYNITWIEHRDKDRLELNFVIPKIELSTGKAFNPYFDKVDRGLVDSWKNIINHDYQLHDPNDPANRQTLTSYKGLPKDKREFSQEITAYLEQKIVDDEIKNRDDVIKAIQDLGLEIARTTPTAVSIKDPDGGRNIRLKGEIYEQTFIYNENYQRENTAKSERYRAEASKRIGELRTELSSRVTAKREFNVGRYQEPRQHGKQGIYERDNTRGISGNSSDFSHSNNRSNVADHEKIQRTTGNQGEYRAITDTSESPIQSKNTGERRQNLHNQQSQSRNMAERQQAKSNGVEVNEPVFETLQRANARVRASSERTKQNSRATEQANREIDKRKQVAIGTIADRTATTQTITSVSSEIKQREREAEQANQTIREANKEINRGFGR